MPVSSPTLRFAGNIHDALSNVFFPKSIAVIGASPDEGTIGRVVLSNLMESGFTGKIFPVNPKHSGKTVHGGGDNVQKYVASAQELPDKGIDLAVIMSPKQTVPAVVRALGEKGVKSVVVISAGFNEVGESGKALEQELKEALDAYGISMIGPNCVGVSSTSPAGNMNATFVSGKVTPGSGAIMSQSGAVSIDLIQQGRLAGLGFSQMASIGNQTDVDSAKLIAHWQHDPSVKYILGYLESIKDPAAFRKIATEVSKEKPIILIKSGKSAVGARAASSHTGSLAGSDTAVEALFTQCGVQRVDDIEDLFYVAKAFELAPPLKGNRVGILSNSGGYGVMTADKIAPQLGESLGGLQVAHLEDSMMKTLQQLLPAMTSQNNPIDTTATVPSDSPENFRKSVLALVQDPNVDAAIVSVVPLLNIRSQEVGRILAEVQKETDKPIFGVLSVGDAELLEVQNALTAQGLKVPPLYRTLKSAVTGLAAMDQHRRWVAKPLPVPVNFPDIHPAKVRKIIDQARAEGRTLLTTTESLEILEDYGIRTATHALINGKDRAEIKAKVLAKANEIGFPSAIKLVSKTITHKTEVGGVAFDLKTPQALEAAFDKMMDSLEKAGVKSFAPGEGIMVQQSIPSGRETLIGFKEDDHFGHMMAFGLGGIYVEIFKDVNFRLAPLSGQDVEEMITHIKGHKILKGYRGKPGVDFDTLKETVLRYSRLVQDFPELTESDINPFFAQPKGPNGEPGGVAVDARFSLKEGSAPPQPKQAEPEVAREAWKDTVQPAPVAVQSIDQSAESATIGWPPLVEDLLDSLAGFWRRNKPFRDA